jgi:flagellar biosynthesis protein FliR
MVSALSLISITSVAARIFGVLVLLPFGDALNTVPRLFIAFLLAVALGPIETDALQWSAISFVSDFIIGLLIASPILILTESAEMFGELIDTARGQTIGSIIDPLNGQQSSDMATFSRLVVVNLAVYLGALDRGVTAVAESYKLLPGDNLFASRLSLIELAVNGASMVGVALRFSAAWMVAYLITDIATALLAKVSSGQNFTSSGTVVKMALTFILLLSLLENPTELIKITESQIQKMLWRGP